MNFYSWKILFKKIEFTFSRKKEILGFGPESLDYFIFYFRFIFGRSVPLDSIFVVTSISIAVLFLS